MIYRGLARFNPIMILSLRINGMLTKLPLPARVNTRDIIL